MIFVKYFDSLQLVKRLELITRIYLRVYKPIELFRPAPILPVWSWLGGGVGGTLLHLHSLIIATFEDSQ